MTETAYKYKLKTTPEMERWQKRLSELRQQAAAAAERLAAAEREANVEWEIHRQRQADAVLDGALVIEALPGSGRVTEAQRELEIIEAAVKKGRANLAEADAGPRHDMLTAAKRDHQKLFTRMIKAAQVFADACREQEALIRAFYGQGGPPGLAPFPIPTEFLQNSAYADQRTRLLNRWRQVAEARGYTWPEDAK